MAVASSADAVLLRYPSRVSWLMAVIVSVVADSATEEATLHVSIYRRVRERVAQQSEWLEWSGGWPAFRWWRLGLLRPEKGQIRKLRHQSVALVEACSTFIFLLLGVHNGCRQLC